MIISKASETTMLLAMNTGQSKAMLNSMAAVCDPRARKRRDSARRAANKMTAGISTKKYWKKLFNAFLILVSCQLISRHVTQLMTVTVIGEDIDYSRIRLPFRIVTVSQ